MAEGGGYSSRFPVEMADGTLEGGEGEGDLAQSSTSKAD